MLDFIYKYCEKEWRIVKDAPVACTVLFCLSCFILFFIMSWHYNGRLDTLRDQVRTYEIKLEVTSPNQAIKKMEQLHQSLDRANNKVTNFERETSLLKPICVSKDDNLTRKTMEQIFVNNEFANEVNDGKFSGYCSDKSLKAPAALMIPPQEKSFLDEMDGVLRPLMEGQDDQ